MRQNPWPCLLLVAAVACSSDPSGEADPPDPGDTDDDGGSERERLCPEARSVDGIPQRLDATASVPTMSFADLRSAVDSACAECHLAPGETGGFSYENAHESFTETARQMRDELLAQRMPPDAIREADPEYFLQLGSRLAAWIDADSPDGSFPLPEEASGEGQQLPPAIAENMTDLGDCVPVAEAVGDDPDMDEFFAGLIELPDDLADTDLFSLDAYELAKRGTLAFNVEYPLWADNAKKGRWVHVPSVAGERQPITLDPETGRFVIPENTRFYKSFFKAVEESDGATRYRKVETRLIVVRAPNAPALFGTYLWNEAETVAILNKVPYRSGEPFQDVVKTLVVNSSTKETRTYAVPGAHRCRECHEGSESESFILGFTPLQIHRRPFEEDGLPTGRHTPTETGEDELNQLERLVGYGVVAGITPETAPKLRESGREGVQPRNDHELTAQAYVTGNCGHCHNPLGFAPRQDSRINFVLAPGGDVFQWSPGRQSAYFGPLVGAGRPDSSHIYKRMINPTGLQGAVPLLHMPLHTPGVDCSGVEVIGKWIMSIPTNPDEQTIQEALDAAAAFQADCQSPEDVEWLVEDFTDEPVYTPRRGDWADPKNGMPESFRSLLFTSELEELAASEIPTGYWATYSYATDPPRPCVFPEVAEPPGGIRPWMVNPDGTPIQPFGEIYSERPGAAYFGRVCSRCHGKRANGESGLARTIMQATGGRTRVANLIDGLFGAGGANLELFNVTEPSGEIRNFAGNYLIWMAMGGTNAEFPPGLQELIGTHGPNMLNQVRQSCSQLLPGHHQPYLETYATYDLYANVCAHDNPIAPEVGFQEDGVTPINPDAQTAWLDRAAQNAGWMIFYFLKEDASRGNWPISGGECEKVFPTVPPSLQPSKVLR